MVRESNASLLGSYLSSYFFSFFIFIFIFFFFFFFPRPRARARARRSRCVVTAQHGSNRSELLGCRVIYYGHLGGTVAKNRLKYHTIGYFCMGISHTSNIHDTHRTPERKKLMRAAKQVKTYK